MKVFYTASYYGKEKYQKYYNIVLQAIKQTGVEIISPEIGNYKEVLTPSLIKKLKSEKRILRDVEVRNSSILVLSSIL